MNYHGTLTLWVPETDMPKGIEYTTGIDEVERECLEGSLYSEDTHRTLRGRRCLIEGRSSLILGDMRDTEEDPHSLYIVQQSDTMYRPFLNGSFTGFYLPAEHRLIDSVRDLYGAIMVNRPSLRDYLVGGLFAYIRGNYKMNEQYHSEELGVSLELSHAN